MATQMAGMSLQQQSIKVLRPTFNTDFPLPLKVRWTKKLTYFLLPLYLYQTLKMTILSEIWVKSFLPKPLHKDKRSKSKHFRRLHENVSEMASRWTGDYVTSMLVFRAEKCSAQASAHPLSQAQGGFFCLLTACELWLRLCRSVRVLTETEWNIRCARANVCSL